MRSEDKKQKNSTPKSKLPQKEGMSQQGKKLEDILPDLLSGEPDDLSFKKKQ